MRESCSITARRAAAALATALLATSVVGQVDWSQRSAVGPRARTGLVLVYDAARELVIGYGGALAGEGGKMADTWEWDGSGTWRVLRPATIPGPRSGHAMAYDSARGRIVMFGGSAGDCPFCYRLGDTWEWNGSNWTQIVGITVRPSPRFVHMMAEDPLAGGVLLFGGPGLTDTWRWDGASWQQLAPAASPPPLWGDMVTDRARSRIVLFGSWQRPPPFVAETWEWDGGNWIQRSPLTTPGARLGHAMTYDAARSRAVLFGGGDGHNSLNDTWEWDGNDWLLRLPAAAPSARDGAAAAYDTVRRNVVLFGGHTTGEFYFGDTWVYASRQPADYATYGAGCAGSAGTPSLAATATGLPWTAATLELRLEHLPSGAPVAIAIGASDATWGGVGLPFDLGLINMPGCSLLASPDVVVPVASSGGSTTWTTPLCACPALVGQVFFNQAFVVDPPANPLGMTVTNGGRGTIGAK